MPLSIKGISAAKHILFTCRLASRLSKSVEDHRETLEPLHVELRILNVCMMSFQPHVRVEFVRCILCHLYVIRQCCYTSLVCSQLTKAFDFLMCSCLKRNCRFKLLRSMVSRSTIWISPKPVRTRFFNSSQPMPPAPTINIRACSALSVWDRYAREAQTE